jgi:hypothetical protein
VISRALGAWVADKTGRGDLSVRWDPRVPDRVVAQNADWFKRHPEEQPEPTVEEPAVSVLNDKIGLVELMGIAPALAAHCRPPYCASGDTFLRHLRDDVRALRNAVAHDRPELADEWSVWADDTRFGERSLASIGPSGKQRRPTRSPLRARGAAKRSTARRQRGSSTSVRPAAFWSPVVRSGTEVREH